MSGAPATLADNGSVLAARVWAVRGGRRAGFPPLFFRFFDPTLLLVHEGRVRFSDTPAIYDAS